MVLRIQDSLQSHHPASARVSPLQPAFSAGVPATKPHLVAAVISNGFVLRQLPLASALTLVSMLMLNVGPALAQTAGGRGGNGGAGSSGGAGGIGFSGAAGTTAADSATGGGGGGGGGSAGGGIGGSGGAGSGAAGGAGGTFAGANGGAGLPATQGSGGGGGGGAGGTNGSLSALGGAGGQGGAGGAGAAGDGGGGGGGGNGGYGSIGGGQASVINVPIAGGAGGNGGAGGAAGTSGVAGAGGSGGDGGIGLFLNSAGTTVTNTSTGAITGGTGGAGGVGGSGATGGAGGAGIFFPSGGTLNNQGAITGGNGGAGTGGASNGAGGVGVTGGFLAITNSGTISGGFAGGGGAQADALLFTGGSNTLTLQNGSSLSGNIEVSGGNTTLTFNQSTAQTVSNLITGNGSIIQDGSGTLTLTGVNTYTGSTSIDTGTLRIDNASALGIGNGVANGTTYVLFTGDSTLEAFFTGTLTKGIAIQEGVSATIGATAGNTLTLAPDRTKGNVFLFTGAAGTTLHFGSAVDTGTVVFAPPGGTINVNGAMAVDGGTLKVGNSTGAFFISRAFGGLTVGSSTTPATFDLNGFAVGPATNLTGTRAGIITNSGAHTTLTVADRGNTLSSTFAGVIQDGASGTGGLGLRVARLFGTDSTLILTGTNTYTGLTTIDSAQTLQLGNGGAGGSIVSNVVNDGTLVFDRSNAFIYAGTISGAGAVQQSGSGTTILTAASSYLGATRVNAGTLEVDGSIAASSGVTVNGTLAGTGTVAATTVMGGGALAPGGLSNRSGALAIAGNLAFQSGALFVAQITSSGAARADVSGTATLTGATVEARFAPDSLLLKQYTILTAAGGLGGTSFAGVASTPRNLQATLSYDANDVFLNLALAFPSSGLNQNQRAVATAIAGFFARTGSLPFAFAGLSPAGLTQASGESATGVQQATFDAMDQFMRVLTDPFVAGRCDRMDPACAPTASAGHAYAAMDTKAPPPAAPTFQQRWSVWAAGYGAARTSAGNAVIGSNDVSGSIFGTVVGADYRFSPDGVAGFALAGGGTSFDVSGLGHGRSELFQAGAFVRQTFGAAYLTAALAYGWQDVTTDRTVTVAGFDQLRGRFDANAWSGRLEGGTRFAVPMQGGLGLTPYAAAQFTSLLLPAYAESAVAGAALFALNYAARTVTDVPVELGIRTDQSFAMPDGIVTLRTRLAWVHDFYPNRSIAATFQTLPGASFVVTGAAGESDAALATASAEWRWTSGWSAAATLEAALSDTTQSYAGRGILRYSW